MKKIIWTPKLYEHNKNTTKWCNLGSHIFINYTVEPPTKICKYCKKVEKVINGD
jgi:hypothetical protein